MRLAVDQTVFLASAAFAILMMIRAGVAKRQLVVRSRACPSCGRRFRGNVCPVCGRR